LLLAAFAAQAQEPQPPRQTPPEELRQTPPEELKLRDELEADQSFLKLLCRVGEGGQAPSSAAAKENLRIWRLVYEAARDAAQTVKAKYTCSTVEGDPITTYIIIEKGKAKIINDASRDYFGSLRVVSSNCDEFIVGTYRYHKNKRMMKFKPAAGGKFDGKSPSFQCRTPPGDTR
jgi:hypothetical protein